MASETVRIKPETHAKLKHLADVSGRSMPEILDDAVEALRRQRLLEETNEAYAALRADAKAWQKELAERSAWDRALADDLRDV
jgi:predicted transcriptional regulator